MKSFRNAPCSAGSRGSLVVKNVKIFGSVKTGSVSYLRNKKKCTGQERKDKKRKKYYLSILQRNYLKCS